MGESVLYSEKPPIPSSIALGFIAPILGSFFIMWGVSLKNGVCTWSGLLILSVGVLHVFPFFDRNLLLTNKSIRIKLWWLEDRIPLEDIVSIEPTNRPRMPLLGWGVGPLGFGYRLLILPLGVISSKGTKWYVFRGGLTYLKINRQSGKPVCVGASNPEDFLDKWKMLQNTSASKLTLSSDEKTSCIAD